MPPSPPPPPPLQRLVVMGGFAAGLLVGSWLPWLSKAAWQAWRRWLWGRLRGATALQGPGTSRRPGPTHRALCRRLHGTPGGPLADEAWPPPVLLGEDHSYPHTNLPGEFAEALFRELRPSFLVELGSFKGGSALAIADALARAAEDAEGPEATETKPCLLCVDTFLGDAAMWLGRNVGWRDWLMLDCGHPRLYWQFLANVRRRRDVVLPLPLSSLCALRALQELVLERAVSPPEFIYLDSAHEKGETLLEIAQAFRLLGAGGVLVGDDLDWPAVESDLCAFLRQGPEAFGAEDPVLSRLPGLFFRPEGFWVLDASPRQWVLRKRGGSLEDLRRAVEAEVNGAEPAEYAPLTADDRRGLALYEEGVALAEAGQVQAAAARFKEAAAASASVAAHFKL